ncbi:hypothetical protein BT96DRAFT_1022799 [Gymnopus androsaceus JB14]|uniref:Uncharacterized protein n=1 Tax=Gymnopus androsaceus JB14 TaxID=1447944 RepID=A0A6A4H8A4_9AGAR|nr:hypothetical protein BT96DRAFT_1022799 [Gymnopus androsaceus JB14]
MKLALSALLFATPLAAIAAGIRLGALANLSIVAKMPHRFQINSAEGSTAIQADIQNVTANSLAIQECACWIYDGQYIGAQLSFIDSENLDSQKFSPTWNEFEQQWTNILWASRTTASNTVAYCTEFTTVIMPFVANLSGPIPPTISVQVLQQYISEAQSLAASAQANAESFTWLQGNITTFVATFQNFASQQQAQDNTQIQQLMADIASLNSKIDGLQKEISDVGVALGATIFLDVFAILLFPEFAPLIIGAGVLAVAGEVAAYDSLKQQVQDSKNEIASDQAQISNLQNSLQIISLTDSTLGNTKNSTATLTTQLGAFDAIWSAVVDDSNQVISYLTDAESMTTIPLIFWATINNVDCYYQAMASALINYADGISNSGIPAPTRRRSLEPLVIDHAELHATATRLVSEGQAKVRAMAEEQRLLGDWKYFSQHQYKDMVYNALGYIHSVESKKSRPKLTK